MAVTDQVRRIKGAKAALKEAIESKGVTVGDGRIDTYAEKVLEIPQGGGGGYQPQDSITILQNGEYNMIHDTDKFYNPVHIEVPQPSGTTNITQNGEHNVAQYETANVQVPEIHNAFKVSTLVERDALQNVQDGDVCVVQQKSIENMTEDTSANVSSVLINPTVTLTEAFQNSYFEVFESETHNTRIDIDVDPTMAYISINNYDTGLYTTISFTSLDGITYTTQDIIQPTLYELVEEVNPRGYSAWNDVVGYFLQVKTVEFPGVYKASVNSNTVTWEYLDIGVDRESEDILLNKKVYTSSGTITGTRDMDKYSEKRYLVSLVEPTDHDLYPIWIEPYNDTNEDNEYFLKNSINEKYITTKDNVSAINATLINTNGPQTLNAGTNATFDVYNNYYYYLGPTSSDSTIKVRKINITTGEISVVASLPNLGNDYRWSRAIMKGNKIYFAPYKVDSTSVYSSNKFYVLDLDTTTFTQLSNFPGYIFSPEIMFHNRSNSIICVGGTQNSYTPSVCYKYNLSTGSWSTVNTSSFDSEELRFFNNTYGAAGVMSYQTTLMDATNYAYIMHYTYNKLYKETSVFFKSLSSDFIVDIGNENYINLLSDSQYYVVGNRIIAFNRDKAFTFNVCIVNDKPLVSNIQETNVIAYDVYRNSNYLFNGVRMAYENNNYLTLIYTNALLRIKTSDLINCNIDDFDATIFVVESLNNTALNYPYNMIAPCDSLKLKIKDCFISERKTIMKYDTYGFVRDNIVKKVYRYNESTNQYDCIIDYSAGPDPDAPQLLSITDIVYNPLDNEGGNSLAPYMLTMNFDKAVTPQNWNMYLRANGQSQQITMNGGSGQTSFKLMFAQPSPDWIEGTTVELYVEPGALVDDDTGTHEFAGVQTTLGIIPPTTVTVSFDSNGGSAVADRTVMYGTPCQAPTNPTRTNYTFNGWLYNGSLWDFNTPVTHSMLLTASWTYVPQEVTPSGVAFNGEKIIYSFEDPDNENHIVLYLPYESRITTINGSKVYQMRLTSGAYCRVYNDYGHGSTFGFTVKPTITIGGQTVSYTEWTDYSTNWNHTLSRTDNGAWITIPSLNGSQTTVELGTSTYFSSNGSTKVFNTTISAPHLE